MKPSWFSGFKILRSKSLRYGYWDFAQTHKARSAPEVWTSVGSVSLCETGLRSTPSLLARFCASHPNEADHTITVLGGSSWAMAAMIRLLASW
jgi:hypothetical protein